MTRDVPGSVFLRPWVAERLERVLGRRADVDGIEAAFSGGEMDLLRLAESTITQASSATEGRVTVRAIVAGSLGIATTGDLTDAGLDAAAEIAIDNARQATRPATPETLVAPHAHAEPAAAGFDAATAFLSTETKCSWLAPALEAHEKDDLALAGRFHTGVLTQAVRSTAGIDVYHQGSFADLSLSALERPAGHRASAYRARYTASLDGETLARLGHEVRAECHLATNPKKVELGEWDVVLAPAALADLLLWLSLIGFSSRSMEDGTSFLAGRIDQPITGEQVHIVDDSAMPYDIGVASPFDSEGHARQRVDLVRAGVARGSVFDTRSAQRAGCLTTGHASDQASLWADGSSANHLHFLPGDASLDELLGQLERGLFISRFHYVNGMLDPRRAVMTGLLRDAAFVIEGGQKRHAVESMRFTDSILEAFARIPDGGVGNALEPQGAMGDDYAYVCPPVLIRGLRFTSGR